MDNKAPGTLGAVPSGSHDQYDMLEDDLTYCTIDGREREVIVLSDNPAYSKHNHTHPSTVSARSMQKCELGAGGEVLS